MTVFGVTYAENDNEEEVDVSNVVELKIQILRQKRQGRVFGSSDFIPAKVHAGMALLILGLVWKRDVEVYLPLFRTRLRGFHVALRTRESAASARLPLLFSRGLPPVEPIHDRCPLVKALVAFRSLGSPSLPFRRLGMVIPSKLYYRHRGWGCAGLSINFFGDLLRGASSPTSRE